MLVYAKVTARHDVVQGVVSQDLARRRMAPPPREGGCRRGAAPMRLNEGNLPYCMRVGCGAFRLGCLKRAFAMLYSAVLSHGGARVRPIATQVPRGKGDPWPLTMRTGSATYLRDAKPNWRPTWPRPAR